MLDTLPQLCRDPQLANYVDAAFGGVEASAKSSSSISLGMLRYIVACCYATCTVAENAVAQFILCSNCFAVSAPLDTSVTLTCEMSNWRNLRRCLVACRHAFDGSGADNMFDAGSCIDGRLTSAWNWCSKIERKNYYHISGWLLL